MIGALGMLAVLHVGCGGNGGGTSGDTSTPTNPTADFDRDKHCSKIPFYPLYGDCDGIISALDLTMEAARSCDRDSDCQVISGRCQQYPETGHCWYPINHCDEIPPPWPDDVPPHGAADLQYFLNAYDEARCTFEAGPCTNCSPEPEVICVDHRCSCIDKKDCT